MQAERGGQNPTRAGGLQGVKANSSAAAGGWAGSCPCSFAGVSCNIVHRCWASIIGAAVTIVLLLGLGAAARHSGRHVRLWQGPLQAQAMAGALS
jgi:hypothetical protein